MRRSDREIKDLNQILNILSRCDTIRLGINGGDYPYVVPLSFGFEVESKSIVFYTHGAKDGQKHDLIEKDNKVCVEASIFHKFVKMPNINALTTEYESFIGFGRAEIISGQGAIKGLDLICEHAGFKGFEYDEEKALATTRIYKIIVDSFTGKRRFI